MKLKFAMANAPTIPVLSPLRLHRKVGLTSPCRLAGIGNTLSKSLTVTFAFMAELSNEVVEESRGEEIMVERWPNFGVGVLVERTR